MVEYSDEQLLSLMLKALGDKTRRSLLTQLSQQGACRITDVAEYYDMSLNAISKHIKVLEGCGLVKRTQIGRVHWISAELDKMIVIEKWLQQLKSIWALSLDKLEQIITDKGENHE